MRTVYRLVLIALLLGLLGGCAPEAAEPPALTRYTTTFVGQMDTIVNFTAYTAGKDRFDAVSSLLEKELTRLGFLFDPYRADSPLARLNASAGGDAPEAAPPELLELFDYCRGKQKTAGGVNVAMGTVLSLWHTARQTGLPPDDAAVEIAMSHASIDAVKQEGDRLRLSDPGLSLDFGAVAKGYVADKLARLVRDNGVSVFLLDCGTSTLVCAGKPPDKAAWQVALKNPNASLNLSGEEQPAEILGTLALTGRCVGVSGDYQKYFSYNGTYYAHILSPDTGRPATYYRMVCVLTDTAADADYYSTALFALPYERARRTAEETPGLEALWMMADGSLRTTDGFPALGR